MLSRNLLKKSSPRSSASKRSQPQEYATLEHLLIALTEDQDAIAVLKACGVDIDRLTEDLKLLDVELSNLAVDNGEEPQTNS